MLDEHLERKINIERTNDPRRESNCRGTRTYDPAFAFGVTWEFEGNVPHWCRSRDDRTDPLHAGRAAWRRCSATTAEKGRAGRSSACRASTGPLAQRQHPRREQRPRRSCVPLHRPQPGPHHPSPGRLLRRSRGPRRNRAWSARNRRRGSLLRHRAPRQLRAERRHPHRAAAGHRAGPTPERPATIGNDAGCGRGRRHSAASAAARIRGNG